MNLFLGLSALALSSLGVWATTPDKVQTPYESCMAQAHRAGATDHYPDGVKAVCGRNPLHYVTPQPQRTIR